jgi:ParB family chromosome partitioning protein
MPFQSRTTEDPELEELVQSLKTYGLLEPILVRRKPSGALEVVAGERRLKAAKQAGLTDIPVVIKPLSDQEACEVQLIENVQRKDLVDIEKARMLDYMIKQFGYLQKDLAKKLGKSEAWISNHLAMLKLKQLYPGKVNEAKITEKQAREILSASPEKREEIIKQVAETGEVPSSREIHRAVQPEPVTTTIPSTESVPEAPTPKPEEKDVGEFECPLCHFKARIAHADPNKHKFVPYSEESLSQ